jgi:tight adherence protein B
MLLVLGAFLLAAGAVVGGYAAITYLPGVMARRQVDRRLREVSMPTLDHSRVEDGTLVKRRHVGPLPALDKLLAQIRAGTWLERLIEQSGVPTSPSAVLLVSATLGALAAIGAAVAVPQPYAWPAAGCCFALLPVLLLMRRRSVRFKRFEEQFPEALDLLSRAIRAGHAFQTAMGMVADELPPPVGPEFKKTFEQQNFGLPLRDALNDLSERIYLLDVRFFVTAVLIQRDTGGNLSEILDNLAHVVRERFKIRRQVRVHTAHGRFTGYVLLALPACLAVTLSFLNPEMMLMGAIVLQTIGFFWIRQVIKIEV